MSIGRDPGTFPKDPWRFSPLFRLSSSLCTCSSLLLTQSRAPSPPSDAPRRRSSVASHRPLHGGPLRSGWLFLLWK
ncbi:hypothetical protein NQZ68_012498 [Dissostichus eleginoides]|nr:hypothetical protein NQZ68_012498 [Dissostichus eleginoides]